MNRALDAALGTAGLTLASPFLAVSALAIKLDDGGPVFYRQRRVGKDGAEFELVKLRTMEVGAEHKGAGFAVNEGDPRITRVGRLLRRLSLDELPQLWNVVRGDMSLIGPRPTLAYQVERYTPRQRRRLEVRPGITGWAQIHGRARCRGTSGSSSTSGTSSIARRGSTSGSSRARLARSSREPTRATPAAGLGDSVLQR